MVRLKPKVSLDNVHPQMFSVIAKAADIWSRYNSRDLWITAANEEGHSIGPRGFHRLPDGTCQAIDIRTWSIPFHVHKMAAIEDLTVVLGREFDVIFEKEERDASGRVIKGEHVHVQYDPKR